jgi:tetratricopeptide (TPR) repeat protein
MRAQPQQTRPTPASSWRYWLSRPLIIGTALAAVTLALYWPIAAHDFVNYDDPDYVTANPHVQTGLNWENVLWAFTTGHASNWHPLTWLSHMLDAQLFGQWPGGHHVVSLVFHAANTLFLLLFLNCLTGRLWRSAMVAALFAWHPLHVESVAWVSERKDVLSMFFALLSLWAYAKYAATTSKAYPAATSPQTSHAPRFANSAYWLALALFALGLMSKPMLVTLPCLMLLLDFWPLARWHGSENQPATLWRRLVLEKAPFFLLAVGSGVVTFLVQQKGGAVSTSISLAARAGNAVVSYARYLGKTFWPDDLSVLYPHPGHWPMASVIGSIILVLMISGLAFVLRRRRPWWFVGWFWFLGTLVPVIGLVQVGIQSMADRYTYLPHIGLFIALVWGLCEWLAERPGRIQALALATAVSLVACALFTLRQVRFWHDSETLFRQAVQVTASNYLAFNNLGFYLSARGKVDEAMRCYEQSLKINPFYEDALNNLGHALAGRKRYADAITFYQRALRVRPDHVEVHNNLGNALSDTGQTDEAIGHYRFVLERLPDHADAHNNLGIALAMKGQLAEAVPHFRAAIRLKPGYASAHSNLGNALAVQRQLDAAAGEYREALRLNPADAQAHNNLGNVLAEQGDLDEAVRHYNEALRLNADNPEAHFNLAQALVRLSRRAEAIPHLQEALRLKPDYPEALRQLTALTGGG